MRSADFCHLIGRQRPRYVIQLRVIKYLNKQKVARESEMLYSTKVWRCNGLSACVFHRPEAANEFYDGDHDNDKESDVEI